MTERRRATDVVQRVARNALRLLGEQEHATLKAMAAQSRVSGETVKRALEWLREQGATLTYDAGARGWSLGNPGFALPLLDPTVEDLQAALTAAGLLQALRQDRAAERAWAIFSELETRLFPARGRPIRREALRVTQTATQLRDPRWMLELLRAARRQVVRFKYRSPWSNKSRSDRFEPWQVGLNDGALYVRGFSRTKKAPRTFNVAHISQLETIDGERPRAPVPREGVWGDVDPRFGVDVDRPGSAILRFRGAVARWVGGMLWHGDQVDTWLEADEVLERVLPFRSCRELARRLMGVADGLQSVEPPELAEELLGLLEAGLRAANNGRERSRGDIAPDPEPPMT